MDFLSGAYTEAEIRGRVAKRAGSVATNSEETMNPVTITNEDFSVEATVSRLKRLLETPRPELPAGCDGLLVDRACIENAIWQFERVARQGRELTAHDLTPELWREYDWGGRVYRIENPKTLYTRPGGTTHR